MMGIVALMPLALSAQGDNSFEQYKAQRQREFNSYKEQKRKEFAEYRRKRNEEFAQFMRNAWEQVAPQPITPNPLDETIPPVVIPQEDVAPINPEPKPIPFEDVIPVPEPKPQPQPINPIDEVPVTPTTPVQPSISFTFFGTTDKVRFDKKHNIRLSSLKENTIADAWLELSEECYTNLVHDCLEIRKRHELCDWAYLMMLSEMSETICGKGTNESVLLMAYVYCQSGYQMRLAIDGQKLYLLVGSRHQIFRQSYYVLDGTNFYPFLRKGERMNERVQICGAAFPQEKPMSLLVPKAQEFAASYNGQRTIKSDRYPNVSATVKINQNLISFYSTYPSSMLDEDFMTRWAMYANTPMAKDVTNQLYPQLKSLINGKSQLDAANMLLNWVQTGFVYEYDDKVWGGDRAFFAEESLNYPYCDCEDRSILFTRIVRDLLGLDCILIYYPGHMACAVRFTENVAGDYISLNGQKFVITDPTFIGAPVGYTMTGMDNKAAKVILLNK